MNRQTGKNNGMFGRTGENHPMFGRSHTIETRKKMSENNARPMLGRMGKNNPTSKAVIIYKDDKLVGKFHSIREAANYLEERIGGSLRAGIQGLLKGWIPKRGQLKGYSAIYKENHNVKAKIRNEEYRDGN